MKCPFIQMHYHVIAFSVISSSGDPLNFVLLKARAVTPSKLRLHIKDYKELLVRSSRPGVWACLPYLVKHFIYLFYF